MKITDVLSQLQHTHHQPRDREWADCTLSATHLDVAKNFPSGENCKCLTNAECAAKSCVVSIPLNFGTKLATLELRTGKWLVIPLSFLRTYPSEPDAEFDIVLWCLESKPLVPAMVRIIMTFRTALANRVRPGLMGVAGGLDGPGLGDFSDTNSRVEEIVGDVGEVPDLGSKVRLVFPASVAVNCVVPEPRRLRMEFRTGSGTCPALGRELSDEDMARFGKDDWREKRLAIAERV